MVLYQFIVQIVTSFVAIFFIIDPFAIVPVYLTLTHDRSPAEIKNVRAKSAFVALCILLVFAMTGLSVFNLFGITLPAFQIAGGILLFVVGINQLNNNRPRVKADEEAESKEREDVSVFPLGTPLMAGPGAISTVVLYTTKLDSMTGVVALIISIFLAVLATFYVLKLAPYLFRMFGKTGLNVVTRLMGMILTAIGVQFVINGLKGVLQSFGLV